MIMEENIVEKFELEQVNQFINQRYGLEFRHQHLERLEEAVQTRSKICKISTVGKYRELIQEQEDEALLLINLLTIHETYFFREPMQLDVMSRQVIPRLLKKRRGRPFLRLLSAGCSTGEEAYSMAIAILSIPGAGRDWDFEVVGVDVDKEALKKAKLGLYGLYSFRSCPKEVRDVYFDSVSEEHLRIKNFVKEKVRFESLNLFEQKYPDWMKNMDIIFYRNVSIYFSKEQRKEVFRRLTEVLASSGSLFLSCTETLDHNNNIMTLVKNDEVFYYKKQVANSIDNSNANALAVRNKPLVELGKPKQSLALQLKKRLPASGSQQEVTSGKSNKQELVEEKNKQCQQLFADALELVTLKKYDEGIIQLDEIMRMDSFFIKACTLKANILLNQQQVELAVQLCKEALVMDTFCLEAYLLLGMAAKLTGEMENAIQRFKEAVYVYPECWLAHYFLAEIYQREEETSYAKREYEVAMRILKQGDFEKHGLSFFEVPFQLDDFIKLCQHNLVKLQG